MARLHTQPSTLALKNISPHLAAPVGRVAAAQPGLSLLSAALL